jgi:cytochrome P450
MTEVYDKWMLQLDPPDHTRLRALVNKAFTPRVVERMAARIRAIVEDTFDRHAECGEMDFVRELAFPLPIQVICEMLGLPRGDDEKIKHWCHALLPSFTPALSRPAALQVSQALGEFRDYLADVIGRKRQHRQDDLLTAMIEARDAGDRLSDGELVATTILLAFAGHASTVQLLAGALEQLVARPDQLSLLRRSPALIPSAVEESLRYISSLQIIYRTTKDELEFYGKRMKRGQMVFLSLIGANFDPAQFPDPDRFDVARSPNRHVAFGHGIHYCAGAALGRLEAQVTLRVLLDRVEQVDLAGPIERESSLLLRGITTMPIRYRLKTAEVAHA